MNKKYILMISFMLLIGLAFYVSASMIEKQNGNYEVSVTLVEGWNLIAGTIPSSGILEDSEIKFSDLKATWYYSLSQKKYILVENSNSIHPDDDEDSVLTSPMWVYSNREGVLKYDTLEDYPMISDRQLMKGWNFLTITPEMKGYALSQLEGSCNIEKAYWWNSETDETEEGTNWKWFPLTGFEVGEETGDSIFGTGIILKVTNDCKLEKKETIPPPTLPGDDASDTFEQCVLAAPFYCQEYKIKSTDLTLVIKNNAGDNLDINSVEVGGCGTDTSIGTVSSGDIFTITTLCTLTSGNNFKGNLLITYKKSGQTYALRSAGTINGEVI